jgi:hypothetical protein
MKRIYIFILIIILAVFSNACTKNTNQDATSNTSEPSQTENEKTTNNGNGDNESSEEPLENVDIIKMAFDYGKDLYDMGLFDGTSPISYEPNLEGAMNREEAMKMIVSALGWEPSLESECPFDDVSAWAKPYVGRAYLRGIALGTVPAENKFGAKDSVTMQQLLTFYLRALGYETSYAYENAIRLGEMKGLTDGIKVSDEYLKRYHLVMVTYNALSTTKINSAKALIEDLILEGRVEKEVAEELGLIREYKYQTQRENGPMALDESNFSDEILGEEKSVVLFYQKGSGSSEDIMIPFNNASIILADIAKAGIIEKDEAGSLLEEYSVTTFPTIKIFKNGEAATLPPVTDTDTLVQWIKNN